MIPNRVARRRVTVGIAGIVPTVGRVRVGLVAGMTAATVGRVLMRVA